MWGLTAAVEESEITPRGLKRVLKAVGADRILVLGPPGVGKSTVIREYAVERAREMGLKFIGVSSVHNIESLSLEDSYLYLQLFSPLIRVEDLAFIARSGSRYDWMLPSKLNVFTEEGVKGLIFIDEITNTQLPDVQTMLFSMVLDKRISHFKLSSNVEIVAAGNPPGESSLAVPLPRPLLDRFRMVLKVAPPTVDEWIEWMESQGKRWDRRVAVALRIHPELLYEEGGSDGIEKTPTPRSWSELAWGLASISGVNDEWLTRIVVETTVGRKAGAKVLELLAKKGVVDDIGALEAMSEEERLSYIDSVASKIAASKSLDCVTVDYLVSLGAHYLVYLLSRLPSEVRREAEQCASSKEVLRDLRRR